MKNSFFISLKINDFTIIRVFGIVMPAVKTGAYAPEVGDFTHFIRKKISFYGVMKGSIKRESGVIGSALDLEVFGSDIPFFYPVAQRVPRYAQNFRRPGFIPFCFDEGLDQQTPFHLGQGQGIQGCR